MDWHQGDSSRLLPLKPAINTGLVSKNGSRQTLFTLLFSKGQHFGVMFFEGSPF